MKTAGRSLVMSWVTPRACQGSIEPLGKTMRVVLMSYPPYSSLVCWIASSNKVLRLYMSPHCCRWYLQNRRTFDMFKPLNPNCKQMSRQQQHTKWLQNTHTHTLTVREIHWRAGSVNLCSDKIQIQCRSDTPTACLNTQIQFSLDIIKHFWSIARCLGDISSE